MLIDLMEVFKRKARPPTVVCIAVREVLDFGVHIGAVFG